MIMGRVDFLWRYLYKEIPRSCLWLEVAECYYVLEPDTAKDASTEATILCKALDDANEILRQRSTTMPGNIILEVEWVSKVFKACLQSSSKVLHMVCCPIESFGFLFVSVAYPSLPD